ncbi:MAG: hypothetical protein AABZ11_03155 [Nitrospinota bacterium]
MNYNNHCFIKSKTPNLNSFRSGITCHATILFIIILIPPHAVFDVVVDACPEQSRRDEVQFLVYKTVVLYENLANFVNVMLFYANNRFAF